MTILQQTPTKLILQFRPWLIWIFGGIFSLVWLPYINYWKKRITTEETAEAITKFLNRQKIYPQD
ncbi:hypothetical protein Cylst_4592 [Cylindrospermum stagnale PCC 7417]|uniref:Uncharacterized protein n=1 Tax=Cylindrospermum stagnale PCC 7417 TaxID=56107 RepID=K9X205_9NOST|nr:hypothetical protein [Cylindrospermum stagnale]AFZ26665.1 hypothetical protein Cylst_4592 [Cylindrospermum stagnale PCC 7417]